MKLTPGRLRLILNLYPPYLGAGVRVRRISADWLEIDLAMKLRWYNRNALGTQFGGSLYAMVDPHFVLLLMRRLGPEYIVWDQAARIEFLNPGRGEVRAAIRLSEEQIAAIRRQTADGQPCRPEFQVEITALDGQVVARVYKTLYVRRKSAA